jgi:hypothetical protein
MPRVFCALPKACVGPSARTTHPLGCERGSAASNTTTTSSAQRLERIARPSVPRSVVAMMTLMRGSGTTVTVGDGAA